MLRLYSWNVNGIRAAQSKGLLAWIHATQPDVLCLQETKAHPDQIDEALRDPDGYHSYWAWSSVKKGYSGVALYSKIAPREVQIGLGIPEYDQEGRTIVADYGNFVLIGAYFPNGARDHSRVPFKMAYKAAFLRYAELFCGDVNTAHRPIDLARPDENENTTGFLPEERAWLDEVVARGYVDIFRDLHPDEPGHYTYWNYWGNARPRNIGWRIDYFFITPDLRPRIAAAEIHADVPGSDHCPISLTLHP